MRFAKKKAALEKLVNSYKEELKLLIEEEIKIEEEINPLNIKEQAESLTGSLDAPEEAQRKLFLYKEAAKEIKKLQINEKIILTLVKIINNEYIIVVLFDILGSNDGSDNMDSISLKEQGNKGNSPVIIIFINSPREKYLEEIEKKGLYIELYIYKAIEVLEKFVNSDEQELKHEGDNHNHNEDDIQILGDDDMDQSI